MIVPVTSPLGDFFGSLRLPGLSAADWKRSMDEWGGIYRQATNINRRLLAVNMKMFTILSSGDDHSRRPGAAGTSAEQADETHRVDLAKEQTMSDHDELDEAHFHKVSQRAYAKWLDEGQAHGRDQEHWRDAEAEVIAEEEQEAAKASAPPQPATETPKPAKSGSKRAA